MTSSNANVIMLHVDHVICAKATEMTSTKTFNATAAKATHVTSTKATHVGSAEAAHVASATTTVSSATAAAGLCTRGNKAAGKHCACQNHHHSSSHDILHWDGRTFRHRHCQTLACLSKTAANVAIDWRWECLSVVSTKFAFILIEYRSPHQGVCPP